MTNLLAVGLGGFLGAAGRYLLSGGIHRLLKSSWYPMGTLGVNVLGCLLIGFVSGLVEGRGMFSPHTRLFLLVGLLGGFTTFSTFSYESFGLLREGQAVAAGVNILLQVILGLAAVFGGYLLSRNL